MRSAQARRRRVRAFVLGLVLVTTPTAMSATHLEKVDPFGSEWAVSGSDSGYCDSAATTTKRSDAFRCYKGSYDIFDPCFSSPGASGDVRCVAAPWSRKSVEVHLTKALPASNPGTEQVWAVALANGARCVIEPQSTDTSHGRVIAWGCTNGALARGLHSGTTWWALWQPSNGAPWKHVSIRTLYK